MASSAEVAADFRDALRDLKTNSRPEISTLTIIAKENTEHAQAISQELESHIRTTNPDYKLPALYVLDSIVKNVGTPYTVYLGRNLYRTFMDAYFMMDPGVRKAMEGLLKTWKQPVPESMDPRPVFSHEVTRDIENALIKFRTAAVQQQQAQRHSLPARPPMPNMPNIPNGAWRNTPTPPQNVPRFAAPNDPRVRPAPFQTFSPVPTPPAPGYGQPPPTIDLEGLKGDLATLITATKATFALNPADVAVQTKLKALLDLETVLRTQTLPPQQLETIRNQIHALSPPPPLPPIPTLPPAPTPSFTTPVNLAQLLSNLSPPPQHPISVPAPPMLPPTPIIPQLGPAISLTPVPQPAPLPPPPTFNLAQLLAQFQQQSGVSTPLPAIPTPTPETSRGAVPLPLPLQQSASIELSTTSMKIPRLHMISKLYLSNLCVTCGRRFENTAEGKQQKARHMDWHFKIKTSEASNRGAHRSWYLTEKDWIAYQEFDEALNEAPADTKVAEVTEKKHYVLAPAGPPPSCSICQDQFQTTWNAEANDFVFMDAISVGGKIYHVRCWEEMYGQAYTSTPSTPDPHTLGKRKAEASPEIQGGTGWQHSAKRTNVI